MVTSPVLTYFTKFLVIAGSDNTTLLKEYRMMKTMNAMMDDGINHKAQFASIKKRNKTVMVEIFLRRKNQKLQQCTVIAIIPSKPTCNIFGHSKSPLCPNIATTVAAIKNAMKRIVIITLSRGWAGQGQGHFCWPLTLARGQLDPRPIRSGQGRARADPDPSILPTYKTILSTSICN